MIVKLWDIKKEIWITKKEIVHVTVDSMCNLKLDGIEYSKDRYELHHIYSEDW